MIKHVTIKEKTKKHYIDFNILRVVNLLSST